MFFCGSPSLDSDKSGPAIIYLGQNKITYVINGSIPALHYILILI
jgi:hypothetical protein